MRGNTLCTSQVSFSFSSSAPWRVFNGQILKGWENRGISLAPRYGFQVRDFGPSLEKRLRERMTIYKYIQEFSYVQYK